MSTNLRKTLFTILIYVAFFASGASSLIAEVTVPRDQDLASTPQI